MTLLTFALSVLLATPLASGVQPPVAESDIRLYGVILQDGGGMALVQFPGSRTEAVRQGESHRGFTVREVLADRVVLESPVGRLIQLPFPEQVEQPPLRAAPPAPASAEVQVAPDAPDEPPEAPVETPSPTVRPSGDGGDLLLSRDDVRLRLQTELPRILQSSVVAPRVEGNDVVGLELIAFPTDTVLGDAGLLPGDVLLTVNDRAVRGMESLAVLVQRFQTASELELLLERAGEPVLLRYRIE